MLINIDMSFKSEILVSASMTSIAASGYSDLGIMSWSLETLEVAKSISN